MEFEAGAACIDKAPAWRAVRFTVAVQGLWHFLSFLCRTPWRLASCCRVVKFEPLKFFLPMVFLYKALRSIIRSIRHYWRALACFQHDTFLAFSFIVFPILSIFKVADVSNGSATRLLAATTSSLAFLMASRHGTRRVATWTSPWVLNIFENIQYFHNFPWFLTVCACAWTVFRVADILIVFWHLRVAIRRNRVKRNSDRAALWELDHVRIPGWTSWGFLLATSLSLPMRSWMAFAIQVRLLESAGHLHFTYLYILKLDNLYIS